MTPGEANSALEGHEAHWDVVYQLAAWAVGNIISPHIKRSGQVIKKLYNSLQGKKKAHEDLSPEEKETKKKEFFYNAQKRRKRRALEERRRRGTGS